MELVQFFRRLKCACQTWTSALLTGIVLVTGSAVPMDVTQFVYLQRRYRQWDS